MKKLYAAIILCFLIFASLFFISFALLSIQKNESPDVFVGIDVAYIGVEQIKALVDEVSSYTNLFVIGSTGISLDPIKLEEMCQSARAAGALGAKMTGAGGGGCMFALAPKRDEALRLCEVLGPGAFVAEVSP